MEVSANEITKELDDIYGIEECKWEILNYVKYLKLDKKDNFANYNVIIHNRSSYPSETKLKLINMADVEVEVVEWLLYPLIPFGKITILQGDPGEGKTTVMLHLIACLTKGEPLSFVEERLSAEAISVIYAPL